MERRFDQSQPLRRRSGLSLSHGWGEASASKNSSHPKSPRPARSARVAFDAPRQALRDLSPGAQRVRPSLPWWAALDTEMAAWDDAIFRCDMVHTGRISLRSRSQEMARTFVILDPAAGSLQDVDALVARIRNLPDVELRITAKAGAAMQSTKTALRKGYEMVVAAGGDRSLNEIVNGLREDASAVILGMIPLGTGNDFARTPDLPTEVDEATALLLAGHTRAIDLVGVTSDEMRYFVNVSAAGFSGLLDEKVDSRNEENLEPARLSTKCRPRALHRRDYFPPRGKGNREFATGDVLQCGRRTDRERAG